MFPIKRLYDLQELDWKIGEGEESLADVRARLADESALVSSRKLLQSLESKLDELTPHRRQSEHAVEQLDNRIQTAEQRLYGGTVTNPRELSAYEQERSGLLKQRSVEEEKLLAVMVETEELQSARDGARQELVKLETDRTVEKADLLKMELELVGELGELRRVREETAPQIPVSGLSMYESLRKTRDGYAGGKGGQELVPGLPPGSPDKGASASQDVREYRPVQQLPAYSVRGLRSMRTRHRKGAQMPTWGRRKSASQLGAPICREVSASGRTDPCVR